MKKIYLLIIIFLLKLKLLFYLEKITQKTKICICTLGKQENRYIREFVIYYQKIGIDKIYLYDNNNITGERFEEVINDFMNNGFVKLIDWRGEKKPQIKMMNDCYKNNYNTYDWLIFYDIDEYVNLKYFSNIKYFLNQKKFSQCQLIYLNLVIHTDNNQLYYENKSLFERFSEIVPITKPEGQQLEIKFILRGHIPNVIIENQHFCNKILKNCNGFGEYNTSNELFTKKPDFQYYYIDHFFSKSTEELIDKIKKGDCLYDEYVKYNKIERYFRQSDQTKEKIKLLKQRLDLNLSNYQ